MAYVVKRIDPLESVDTAIKSIRYPPPREQTDNGTNGVHVAPPVSVCSEIHRGYLGLFECHDHSSGLRKYLRDLFGLRHPDYVVILHQDHSKQDRAMTFVLYEGNQELETHEAFQKLHSTFISILHDGSVMLTEPLVRLLVLPHPQNPSTLSASIVELMEKKSHSHPEWPTVIQALLHHACRCEDREQIETLIINGGDLEKKNPFDLTPIMTASSAVSNEGMKWLLSITRKIRKESIPFSPIKVEKDTLGALVMNSTAPVFVGIPKSLTIDKEADDNNSDEIWLELKQVIRQKFHNLYRIKMDYSDAPNFAAVQNLVRHSLEEKSSLMISIENNYIKSCIYLLLGGADPNYAYCSNTSLHFAVKTVHPLLVKILLVFDADPTIKNSDHKTPLDLARELESSAEKQDIIGVLEDMTSLRESTEQYFLNHSCTQPVPQGSNEIFLLSMDGGGVRGANSQMVLDAIEKRMFQLCPSSQPLKTYFDYYAGTSFGGMSALLMAYTELDMQMQMIIGYKMMTEVLSKSLSERKDRVQQYLLDTFREDIVMADMQSKRVIVTSTLADRDPSTLHLVTNYGEARDGQKGPSERKVWEAAGMTTAAPTFFPAFEGKFLDGGLMSNNPTIDALVEIFQQSERENAPVKIGLVLSLGTGVSPVKPVENVEVFMPGFCLKSIMNISNTLQGLSSLIDLFLSEITQSDGQQVLRAKTWCKSIGANYYRLSPPLDKPYDPASASIDNFVNMVFNTKRYILSIPDQIDNIAKAILSK